MRYIPYIVVVFSLHFLAGIVLAQDKTYVGSQACKECHEGQYLRFNQDSKKAGSFDSIAKMESRLTPEEFRSCFQCHTTGYGREGGFVSMSETPDLKYPGCEVCHGPGSLHAESGDPDEIQGRVTPETCGQCHSSDRIKVFDFKPLLFGGAH